MVSGKEKNCTSSSTSSIAMQHCTRSNSSNSAMQHSTTSNIAMQHSAVQCEEGMRKNASRAMVIDHFASQIGLNQSATLEISIQIQTNDYSTFLHTLSHNLFQKPPNNLSVAKKSNPLISFNTPQIITILSD